MNKKYTLLWSAFLLTSVVSAQTNDQLIADYFASSAMHHRQNTMEYTLIEERKNENTPLEQVYIQYEVNSIPVYNTYGNFRIHNKQIVSFTESQTNHSAKINATSAALSLLESQKIVADHFKIPLLTSESHLDTLTDYAYALYPEDDSLTYYPQNDDLILSHVFVLKVVENGKVKGIFNCIVDAQNGEIRVLDNEILHCRFHEHAFSNSDTIGRADEESEKWAWLYQAYESTQNGQYLVYPLPLESPVYGERQMMGAPAFTNASPEGWHRINGVSYTTTKGNNVDAVADTESEGYLSYNGLRAKLTDYAEGDANGNFNFDIDPLLTPYKNKYASATNLFYMNNMMHDIWYQYGFDEANGNFQKHNYLTNTKGNDAVIALAQTGFDANEVNNATFYTPKDGYPPIMSMYLFEGKTTKNDNIHIGLGEFAGDYEASVAPFSPLIPINGKGWQTSLALGKSASDDTNYFGCSPLVDVEALKGKFVLLQNGGGCSYLTKAKNVQFAGAKGLISVSDKEEIPHTINAIDFSRELNIVGLMVAKSVGLKWIDGLEKNKTLDLTIPKKEKEFPMFDGALDNGIVAHEYGHGISNRLTGPLSNATCLRNEEQMGEGWSDYFALTITMKAGDKGVHSRGMGQYAMGQDKNGRGIRPTPYSTDLSINPANYSMLKGYGHDDSPHNTGYVWASMLWDMTWNLVGKYGLNLDVATGNGGNNIAMQLVIDGLKLQPCSPGFVDGRDAILKADQLMYNSENQCEIWSAFAKRGLGYSAEQGSTNDRTDGIAAYDMPPTAVLTCALATNDAVEKSSSFQLYPNPVKEQIYFVDERLNGQQAIEVYDLTGNRLVKTFIHFENHRASWSTHSLPKGIFILKIKTNDAREITKKIIKQ